MFFERRSVFIGLVHIEGMLGIRVLKDVEPQRAAFTFHGFFSVPLQEAEQFLSLAWPGFDAKQTRDNGVLPVIRHDATSPRFKSPTAAKVAAPKWGQRA